MTLETLRGLCLSFPGATEQIQWSDDLVFKVGGKMFCVASTEPDTVALSFKCDDETFAALIEQEGIIPAPYLARAKWVALERLDALPNRELQPLITRSYELVRAKLPARARDVAGSRFTPRRRGPDLSITAGAKPARSLTGLRQVDAESHGIAAL